MKNKEKLLKMRDQVAKIANELDQIDESDKAKKIILELNQIADLLHYCATHEVPQ